MLRNARSLVITRTEAARALGVDPRTITAGIENGTLPSVKLGRRVVIPREKFLRLFEPVIRSVTDTCRRRSPRSLIIASPTRTQTTT
ncbi:MAG: helix-turn-helix domain-containing protein [Rhodococcus sp. (in: high G+C Gram-positive bacteria)]